MKDVNGTLNINFNELMKQVQEYKEPPTRTPLTEEQILFLKECRKKGLSYSVILRFWNSYGKWRHYKNGETIRNLMLMYEI